MGNKKCGIKGNVGGQALIEGVMMKSKTISAMAVRMVDGTIDLEKWDNPADSVWRKIPIIRGIINFVITLVEGYKCLGKSAEKSGLDDTAEPEGKFEMWLDKHFGDKLTGVVVGVGVVLALVMSVCLFMLLPAYVAKGLSLIVPLGDFKALVEGLLKIGIFIGYLALVSKNGDIKRVFEYHGAEHKTIFCYEAGEDLTVENVRSKSRFHPRCGTSFMLIILILSILVFSLPIVPWDNMLIRTAIKLALMPVILGIAYEFIKLAGRHNNWFTRAISYPGLKLQHLTTREPDDSQIEVAIAALEPCIGIQKADITQVEQSEGENANS